MGHRRPEGEPPFPEDPAGASGPARLLALERRLAQYQRLAALGALVARLAHELGTPLHSIAGHLDLMLADPELSGPHRRRTMIVSGELHRLSQLIRRYLQHLQSPEPKPTAVDLRALVEGILAVLEPVVSERRIAVTLDFEEGVEVPFECDPHQIEQAVLNLLQNAIDAMPRGGDLTVRMTHTDSGRALSVCDSGSGIRANVADHVFEPFFSTKGKGRGSGLGLAICREIARAHGGDIRLDSQRDVGTVVTLTLEPSRPVEERS